MKLKTVGVRLEGGLGDHVLGLRILPFISKSFPGRGIVAYSDSGGHCAQLDVCAMSPYVAQVVPVYKASSRFNPEEFDEAFGTLGQLRESDQSRMMQHEAFFDAWGKWLFIPQSRQLGVSFYEILNTRPSLVIPDLGDTPFVDRRLLTRPYLVLNLAKYGVEFLRKHFDWISGLLGLLLEDKSLTIVNLYHTSYDFPHWPNAWRTRRREKMTAECAPLAEFGRISPRILPIIDAPFAVAAAVLKGCTYYLGVDNGLKHVAWALELPLTYLIDSIPEDLFIARWMPDFHRALLPGGDVSAIERQVRAATEAKNRDGCQSSTT